MHLLRRGIAATTWLIAALISTLWSTAALAQTSGTTGTGSGTGATPADPLPEWAVMFEDVLSWDVLDVPLWRLTVCIFILIIGLALKNYIIKRLLRPIEALLGKTETSLDDQLLEAVRKPLTWVVFLFAVWAALKVLRLPDGIDQFVGLSLQTFGTVFIAWMLYRSISIIGELLQRFTEGTKSDVDDHLVPLVVRVLRVVLVIFAVLAIIQQWGYDVTSLIAGLGIGGLAFALAAQDTLSNWFGSLMIFTDRPFTIGDWVKTGDIEGVIEEVGLRSTKIRTFDKSLITVPNRKIAHDSIENFSERERRRTNTTIGLTYGTTHDQITTIVEEIRTLLAEHPLADPESVAVYFKGFGESTLDIRFVVFFTSAAYHDFMTAQQEVFFGVMKIVEEAGSAFAFPSRSLYFESAPPTNREPGD